MKKITKICLFTVIFFLLSIFLSPQGVVITGDSTINQCETKTYTISIQNNSGNPLTNIIVTAKLANLTGFSYVNGTSSIDVNGGAAFCTANPTISGTDLTWNIDTQCGGPFTLNNLDTLNVRLNLQTDCTAVSGSLNIRLDYRVGGTPMTDETGAHSIQVLPGGITIKKTPNVIPQELGQNVTWTLTVENTGFGTIKNVVVTDVLGAGLAYAASTPGGVNSGQTTTWGPTEIPGFSSMNPGDTITIDLTADVMACDNLDNNADARWGCDLITDCYNTAATIPPSTATASVQRIVKTPLLQFTPPDVGFNYCDDYADVSFTITNIGDGRAHDIWLNVDFGALTVSNVSAGALYNNVNKRFELTNSLAGAPGPGNTYLLSFRLNYNTWCGGTFPTGPLLWQTVYNDDCDNPFYPPVELSTINPPANSSALSVEKTGAPAAVQIGSQVTYTIASSYSGPLNCGTGSTGTVTVVDTLPNGFTVIDAGGGTWVPGGGGTGGTVTWTYTPPATLNTSLTVQVPGRAFCETYCFTTFTNTIQATVVDCCGCTLNANGSQTTAIECEELVDSDKTAAPVPGIRCGEIQYTNTYVFADNAALDTVDVSQLVFREAAENEQEYVPGSLQVTLSGVGDITACAQAGMTDTTPGGGGTLDIDFNNCGAYGSVRSKTLTISYRLRITESTVGPCSGLTFYSWSSLNFDVISGSECLPDGTIYETTPVSVEAPAMALSITGLDPIIDKCQTQSITLTLTQTSGTANPRDVRLRLSGLNYYIVNPAATVCSGDVAPTSCTPVLVGDDYVWYFADGFNGPGQRAVLQLTIQKRCNAGGALEATAYFDDNCNNDANYDDSCSVNATESPALLLSGDLLIEKNPEVYFANTNTVEWKIYVTNRGNGTAYNVWIDDILGSGLDFGSAVVSPDNGDVTVTADQNHTGGAINGCTIAITEMAPGQRRTVTLQATLLNCNNLTNNVSTSWGCVGDNCQVAVSDSSTVEIPRPLLINTNVVTTPAEACTNPSGIITLKNAGQTTCYNLQVTETLPAGLLYISGSTRWRVNGGAWNGPNAAYDPNPTVSPLQWTSTQIPGLATADPGDTIEIDYDLTASCPFNGGDITVTTSYENPCGQVFNTADSVFTVAFRAPNITVTKTRANEPIDCGELIEWTITVRNTSGYTLPIIWVEDTMDAAFTYDSSVGDPPYTSDNGTFDGVNKVSWELSNVANNDTVTLTLRATTDTAPCSPNLDNTVMAWWGCGAADGSSATKPGVNPPDNNLCLTSVSTSTVRTETREPSVGFMNIALNPTSIDSCNDATELTVTMQNTGPTDAANVDLVVTLPPGITYVANSSAVTCGGVLTDPAPEPVVSGNQLIYYNIANPANNLCNLVQAAGGNDTVILAFSVGSNCYVTDNIGFRVYYYDCCADTQYNNAVNQTLTALFPSLIITKSPQGSQVNCGANQTWTVTVTNNGTGNAQVVRIEDTLGTWLDYVGSAPAATLISGQTYGWEINNLAVGASQVFNITAQLNPDAPQNNCSLLLRQNNARAIWGCGTTGDAVDNDPTTTNYDCVHNAWSNATAANLAMPDLVVTAITPSITCTTDGTFSGTISVTVSNQGDGTAAGGFQVSVSDGNGWTGTGSYAGDLAPGGTANINIDVTGWNPDCTPCTYNFSAAADSGNTICECREDNNNFGPQSYMPSIANLQVDNDTLAITCVADGQYRISGTVILRNAGCSGTLNQNVPVRFTLHSGTGCTGAQVAQWTQTFTGVSIPAGSTQIFTITNYDITGNACSSASGCQFSIRTEADYTNTICECDGNDNTRCSDKNFTIPDLRVVSDTLAISCSADGQIRIQGDLVVANDGCGANLATNIPIRIRVYTNNAACSGVDGNLVFNQAGVNIPAGGTQTFAINRTLNRNLCTNSTGCQVAVGVELDYTSAICECNGTNNSYCSPNKVVSIPDLQVTGDSLGINCLQDGQVRVSGTVTVANTGCNAAAAGNLPVRFTLFSNINCGGVQLDQWTETFAGANIAAGGSQVFTITNRDIVSNICTNSTGCQVSLRIEADPGAVICECNGGNNSRCANKAVSVPDLRITAITPNVTCSTDGNLTGTVQVTVNNNGCGAANNILVRLTSSCGFTFGDQTIAALAGGASTTVTFSVTANIAVCNCTFTAAADPDNTVCECNGLNNTLTSGVYNISVPDITVTADALAITCASDGAARISGTITLRNQGCGANLTTNVPVRFTLYDNTGCSGNVLDQWTQELEDVNIPAGGSQVFTIGGHNAAANLVTNSNNCRASLRIEADYNNTICESDGTNNSYCTGDKNVDIPDLQVTDDTLAVSCFTDGRISVTGTVTIANTGCGSNVVTNLPVHFILYNSAGCSNVDILQWNQTFTAVNIAAGGSQVFTITPQIITTDIAHLVIDCSTSFHIEADYLNVICEADGNNNTRCSDKALDIIDIEIPGDNLEVGCSTDGQVQVMGSITLQNSGCGSNLTADVPVRFTLYDNIYLTGNILAQWTETLTGVNIPANGGTQDLNITPYNYTGNMCLISSACEVSIMMEADYNDVICESAHGEPTNNSSYSNKNIVIPDLSVNSVTPTSTCTNDSSFQGTVSVNITNSGCGNADNVVVRLTSSCGYVFADQTINLPSGSNTNVDFTYTPSCLNCNCTFTAVVDPDDTICECDGTNNSLTSAPFSLDVPDITVENDALAVTCAADGQVTVSGTITLGNHGCGSNLTAGVPVRLTLYSGSGCTGSQLNQWTQTLTGVNIAPGGGTQSFTITPQNINANLMANCLVSLRVEADYNDSICECDGTNNNYCSADKTVDIPDIRVNSDTLGVTCAADGQVTVSGTVTLANSGCGSNLTADIPVRFTLFDNTGCSGNTLSQWTETLTGVNIPAGGGTQVFTITGHNVTTNLVANSTNCRVSIRMEVDYTNSICEGDNTNNTYCADNKAVDIPDIQVQNNTLSITCSAEGQANISGTVTLANNGCGAGLTADIPVRFTLYDNTGCTGSPLAQWTETLTGINIPAGGGTQVLTITPYNYIANLCAVSTGCRVSLRIETDYNNTICESDGTNNNSCTDYLITVPDLSVASVTAAATCTDDSNFQGTVTVNVANTGCAGVTNAVVRLTASCGYTFTDQTLNLAAGANTNVVFTYTPSCLNCNCTFTAVVDPGNTICECDGTNNSLTSAPFSLDVPDITVENDALAVTCAADGQVSVSGTITLGNHGCGSNLTAGVPVRLTLYSGIGCTGSPLSQWTQTLAGANIAPGGGTQTFTITPQNINTNLVTNSTNCRVSLRVEADYNDSICECDGTNNNYCSADKNVDIPDIRVSSDTLGVTCAADGQVTVSGTVTLANSGCGSNLTADIPVRFTLFDNTGCSGNTLSQWTETLSGVNIPAGGGTQVFTVTAHNLTTNLVANSTNCRVSIRMEVDYTNSICEGDNTNNTYCADNKAVDIPDLRVQAENTVITCMSSGQFRISGSITLQNNGCGTNLTADVPVQLTLYNTPGCSGTPTAQWTETLTGVNIPAGGGTQVFTITPFDITANICAASPGCTVSLAIAADYTGTICESDGTNNTLCTNKPLNIPNLVVNNVATSIICLNDGNLTGTTVNVANTGCADAAGVVVRLTSDCGLTFTDQVTNLAAGESKDILFTFLTDITTCNCTFTAVINPDNTICECDNTDNTRSSTNTMIIPDIVVTAETLTVNCLNDGVIRVAGTVTLGNDGCGADFIGSIPMRFTLFSNTACAGNQVAQWTETFTGALIPSAGTQTFTIQAHDIRTNFSANSTDCMVSLLIEADYSDTICEWNGTNNTLCTDKTSECLDLAAGQLTVNTTCRTDGNITGNFTLPVRNSGGRPVTRDFQVRIDDGEGWSAEKWFQADLGGHLPLAPGATQTVTIDWTREFTRSPYVCHCPNITAVVDSHDHICESDAANNTVTITYDIPYPDLAVKNFAAVCSGDGRRHLRLTVGNDGCAPVNHDFNITFSDIPGQTQTVSFTSLGGDLPLAVGTSQTVILDRWTFDCTSENNECTVALDTGNQICDLNAANDTFQWFRPATEPDLVMDNVTWTCHDDGSITFVATVSNQGHGPAYDAQFIVYDAEGKVVYTERINLIKGEVKPITFTTGIYPKAQDNLFRFILDEEKTICECNGNNNEKSVTVNCVTPGIQLIKNCPPGANPGGLIQFEVQVINSGDADFFNVSIEDYLPERFQYVPGSSTLNGAAFSDPEPGNPLIWRIGDLNKGLTAALTFSAVVSADIKPGRYCNEAQAIAEIKDNLESTKSIITSGKIQCCTTISSGLECCLKIEETLLGPVGRPRGLISSYIEPYFPTEDAMFTVYAALNLWKDEPLEKETMPLFMKERLQNYALTTMEEFYFGSKLGLTLPDGSLWLSYAGAYPDQDDKAREKNNYRWLRRQVNDTITSSQIGFELLALNETLKAETREDIKGKLKTIIQKKLDFLSPFIDDCPHGWKLNDNKKNEAAPETDVPMAIANYVEKLDKKAGLYDNAALYLAMIELNKSGFSTAATYGEKLKTRLAPIDNTDFDPAQLRAEFIYTLALVQAGQTEQAKAKIQEFEKKLAAEKLPQHEQTRTEKKEKEDKILLNNIRDHALAAAVDYKAGGTVYHKLKSELKEKYYMKDTGILADIQPDFTFQLTLESVAPLLLSFNTKDPVEQENNAAILYRTFDEIGLFLKKRNIVRGNPLYSILKNYPFSEPLLPVLPLTKAQNNIAPVFSQSAVIHSTQLNQVDQLNKPGEILFPQRYSKILSSGYETDTSRIASVSFGLQHFGRKLMQEGERVNAEEGRSLDYTGKRYVETLLTGGAGIQAQGLTLLPYDTIAVKGPKQDNFNLEPLNAGTRFSTQTLADYLLAEKYYTEGPGKYTDSVRDLMKFQARIVAKFKETGYIPGQFHIYIDNQNGQITLVPSQERASKLTIAKLFHVLPGEAGDELHTFLKGALNQAKGALVAEDIIFFSAVPEWVPYFKKEIAELVKIKDEKVADSAADVIGRQLLGEDSVQIKKSLDNLVKHWDQDAVMPVSDRVEHIERGLIYRHEPRLFLLYLLAANTAGASDTAGIINTVNTVNTIDTEKDFRFKRTLNFFSYLLENEWGIANHDNNGSRYLTLPSQEYRIVKEQPRVNAEAGDILLFKVKVDNLCPQGTGLGHDLTDVSIKANFTPPLIYGGSEEVPGLEPNGLFQWRYENLVQGSSFEFIYQAYVPGDFSANYIDGSITAYGIQGSDENGTGNKCEDTARLSRLDVVPLTQLRGVVFEDRNVNGFKDLGEPGIPNILFKDTRGYYFRSDAEGRFTIFAGKDFEGVQMELKSIPANYLYIPSDLVSYHGPHDYLVITEPTRLVNKNYVGEIYFGLIPCKTVTGFVYIDENDNGDYDEGENKPAGVQLDAKDKQVVTSKEGQFIFRNLPELWQEWIKVNEPQLFYKEDVKKLKIKINK